MSDLGHDMISDSDSHVRIDPRLADLPHEELLAVVKRQAEAIRILQHKARERAAVVEALERKLRDPRD
jgi:hypothetical protein